MTTRIDFSQIRGQTIEGQRASFEQLVCHLARLERDDGEFRRIDGAGGDGGVEAIRVLPSGRKVGYQAKFHLTGDAIDWGKITKSVTTALTQHPEIERYVIAVPCDFTGKRAARGGSTEGVWGKWDEHREHWAAWARTHGLAVEFEPWTAFEVEAALRRPRAQHLIRFFFDRLVFTRAWMERHRDRTLHDLQARYSPDEHVDTESLAAFDVIYRRETVRRDLHAVFEVARGSDLDAAADLIGDAGTTSADIDAARRALDHFLELEAAVDQPGRCPIGDWFASWHALTRRLYDLPNAVRERLRETTPTAYALAERVAAATKAYELGGPEVFGGRWAYLLPIDGTRAAVFVGRAGAGKSHALARGADIAWKDGASVIHLLGQHIVDDDPRVSILKRLELTEWPFEEVLSALDLVAEADGKPAMLIIDALNEGRGTEIWRSHLASFVREVHRHEHLVLVLSCREEYLDYVVPDGLIAVTRPYEDQVPTTGKLVRVDVNGFRTTAEREAALQMFMDAKGIARPTAPVLDEEFFNPLFMSSVCRSMARAGIKVFPRGLHGAREIFRFVMETKAKALGTKHDGTPRAYPALRGLRGLASVMVKHRGDQVALAEAHAVVDAAFQGLPLSEQTWLTVLEGADILRVDVERPAPGGEWHANEVVRFSFQRLQDNLIAQALIDEVQELEDAFEEGGPLAFLIRREFTKEGQALLRPDRRWVGVLGALWSTVAEQPERKELWDLKSFLGGDDVFVRPSEFRPVVRASIRERSGVAFTGRTKALLDWLWQEADDQPEKLEILLATACVPAHAWNADFLHPRLASLSVDERDSAWSRWFAHNRASLVTRAWQIVHWAREADLQRADVEVVRLAALTLVWLLPVHNDGISRDARDALRRVLAEVPSVGSALRDPLAMVTDSEHVRRLHDTGAL